MSRSPLLVISRLAPWSGMSAREALDVVLAATAFDLPTHLLLLDDGVWQVVPEQAPHLLEQKNLQANLQALPLFGIQVIHVCRESLKERAIPESFTVPVECLDTDGIRKLIDSADHILSF